MLDWILIVIGSLSLIWLAVFFSLKWTFRHLPK